MHKFVCILCRCRPMTVFLYICMCLCTFCALLAWMTLYAIHLQQRGYPQQGFLVKKRSYCLIKVKIFLSCRFNQGKCCRRRRFGPTKLSCFIQDLMDKETLFTTDLCMDGHLYPRNFWCINHCLWLQIARPDGAQKHFAVKFFSFLLN